MILGVSSSLNDSGIPRGTRAPGEQRDCAGLQMSVLLPQDVSSSTSLPSSCARLLRQQSAVTILETIRKWGLGSEGCVQGDEVLAVIALPLAGAVISSPWAQHRQQCVCDTQSCLQAGLEPSPGRRKCSLPHPAALPRTNRALGSASLCHCSQSHNSPTGLEGGTKPQGARAGTEMILRRGRSEVPGAPGKALLGTS